LLPPLRPLFVRNSRQQQYGDRVECQKARNAKNQRDFRKRKAIEKAQTEKSGDDRRCFLNGKHK
jgi:hypothetical protein